MSGHLLRHLAQPRYEALKAKYEAQQVDAAFSANQAPALLSAGVEVLKARGKHGVAKQAHMRRALLKAGEAVA